MRFSESHLPAGAPLESWSDREWTDGVQIDELRALDHLCVRTRNSTYDIVVTAPETREVLVRGGARFPSYTRARVCGSTAGGTVVKHGGIYPGFRIELDIEGHRILTSPVAAIDREATADEQ